MIGPNGVGKTTLFKTIVGLEKPDSGTVRVGDTVKLSYVDQSRAGIDPKKTVWQVFRRIGLHRGGPERDPVAGLRRPSGSRARISRSRPVCSPVVNETGSTWSHLKQGGNLLLLDEPTNDLDVETLARWRTH